MIGWFRRKRAVHPPNHAEPTTPNGSIDPFSNLEALIAEADARRDEGDREAAASAYARALEVAPWRTDLTVQQGNMCKDSARLPEAERLYGMALEQDPDDADIHVQLGHVMKLMGRRARAAACYRRALVLDPACTAAQLELVQAGIASEQNRTVAAQFAAHGIERMMSLGAELAEIRDRIESIGRDLPAIATWTAIPADHYALFRRLYDSPPAPPGKRLALHIVAAADGAPVQRLHALLETVRRQSVDDWRLVVHGTESARRAAVERVALVDTRIGWMQHETGEIEGAAERRAADLGSGLILLLDHGASLHPRAAEWLGRVAFLSSDTVFCADQEATVPNEISGETAVGILPRTGFDPEWLLQRNVWGNTLAVTAAHWAEVSEGIASVPSLSGRRSALLLKASGVAHLPLPLIRQDRSDAAESQLDDHAAAVRTFFERTENKTLNVSTRGDDHADHPNSIEVLIPTRNNAADCRRMVDSLFAQAERPEALLCSVLDNATDRAADRELLGAIATLNNLRVRSCAGAFNWSALNNDGAAVSDADILVFANDDMAMLSRGWDTALRRLLARPETGAVGAKLIYPDNTIQHAGVLFGWQGSVIHDGLHEPAGSIAHAARWQSRRRVSAVTGAFLAVRRSVFEAAGGFDARALPIGYSDIDLCLKLRARGLNVLYEPAIVLEHAESRSRGLDHLEQERQARDLSERRALIARWGQEILAADPAMNPIWHDATLPFRLLRPIDADQALRHAVPGSVSSGRMAIAQ